MDRRGSQGESTAIIQRTAMRYHQKPPAIRKQAYSIEIRWQTNKKHGKVRNDVNNFTQEYKYGMEFISSA